MDLSILGRFEKQINTYIPFFLSSVKAGFPSPADDFIERRLDLNEYLIKHPEATFFVRVSGDSMIGAGIFPEDILVVDRSLNAKDNSVIIAALDGELTVKRLKYQGSKTYLYPENINYKPIQITKDSSFFVWGVVTNVIHKLTNY